MIPTIACSVILVAFLTNLSSGVPVKNSIQTKTTLRGTQHFNPLMGSQIRNKRARQREERSTSRSTAKERICEVEESRIHLTNDIAVTASKCKTPGTHQTLGKGYTCRQDYIKISFPGPRIKAVPSGCNLFVADSLQDEPSPLTEDDLRFRRLQLSPGVHAEQRLCASIGDNKGNYRLDGREYVCDQRNLTVELDFTVESDLAATLLPSGCVCYLRL